MTDQQQAEQPQEGAPTTPPADEPQTEAAETFDREYVEKLRRENEKWRKRLREKEEAEQAASEAKRQAELTAEQRAREAEERAKKALAEADEKVLRAERRADLAAAGFRHPERIMRLIDDPAAYWVDGQLDPAALARDFSEYAPSDRPAAPAAQGQPSGTPKRAAHIAALNEQLDKARTRAERVAIQTKIANLNKEK
jgi:hypothetical protein